MINTAVTKEPVITVATVTAIATAVLTILHVFDIWTPTTDQQTAILAALTALVPLFGFWVRSAVTPNASVAEQVAAVPRDTVVVHTQVPPVVNSEMFDDTRAHVPYDNRTRDNETLQTGDAQ